MQLDLFQFLEDVSALVLRTEEASWMRGENVLLPMT